MYIHDLDSLRFLEVNAAAVAHYGYTREELLAMTALDIRPVEDAASLGRFLAEVGRTAPDHGQLWRHRNKRGEIMLVKVTSAPVIFAGRAPASSSPTTSPTSSWSTPPCATARASCGRRRRWLTPAAGNGTSVPTR